MVEDAERKINPNEPDAAWLRCGRGAFFYMHGSRFIQEAEMIIDDEEFDDDFDEPTPAVECPECGSNDLEVTGESEDGDAEFVCNDCGERFTEGEEEE